MKSECSMLSSLGVIVAAALKWWKGWNWADPAFSVLIGFFILPRTWSLMLEAMDILMESMPRHLNSAEIEVARAGNVLNAHDLHVWTILREKLP